MTPHGFFPRLNRLRGMLDKGEAVKDFVDALLQLANPDMVFKVKGAGDLRPGKRE